MRHPGLVKYGSIPDHSRSVEKRLDQLADQVTMFVRVRSGGAKELGVPGRMGLFQLIVAQGKLGRSIGADLEPVPVGALDQMPRVVWEPDRLGILGPFA